MHYFITGGTGFIGSQLIDRLLQDGYTVTALIRPQSTHKATINHPNLHWIEGDIQEPQSLIRAMKGCDRVFHMAAKASVWAPREKDFWDINLRGTKHILEAAKQQNIDRLVFTSTAATLPPASYTDPTTEESEKKTFLTPYEESKSAAEELVRSFTNSQPIDAMIVNPTRVFGPGPLSESNAVTRILKMYKEGKWRFLPGEGTALGNYGFIDDVVDGHIKSMEHGSAGDQYILGGTNITFRQLFDLFGEITGKRRFLFPLPTPLMRTFGRFEVARAEIFGSPPAITPAWIDKYLRDWAISSEKAEQEIGYRITPLRKAVQKTFEWIQKEKFK